MLFDIAIERLSVLFQRASFIEYFKGIDFGNGKFLSHLQYIDDTLVFMQNEYNSLIHVKRSLRWFELASYLKVNFYKSSLVAIKLNNNYTASIANAIYLNGTHYRSDT